MNMVKAIRSVLLFLFAVGISFLTACSAVANDTENSEKCETHEYNDGTVISAADCGNPEITVYTCKVCKDTYETVTAEATGGHVYSDGICTVCGYIDMSGMNYDAAIAAYGYCHLDTDSSQTITTGDYILFGSYPQTKVTDTEILDQLQGKLNDAEWTSYGYVIENQSSDAFTYQDVELNGTKYRAVLFTEYRPYFTDLASDHSFVEQNGYQTGKVYWFVFEPVQWRVLDYAEGEAQLLSQLCLDSQSYQNGYTLEGNVCKSTYGTNANDYAGSYIRAFLNGDFYNWAFTNEEQQRIVEVILDNITTGYSMNNEYSLEQKNTEDKVYLLSFSDLLNERYGFPNVDSKTVSGEANGDTSVCKSGTDYALAQGLRISNTTLNADGLSCSYWMLRSSGGRNYSMCGVTKYGTISRSNSVAYKSGQTEETDGVCFYTAEGVAPAITFKPGK